MTLYASIAVCRGRCSLPAFGIDSVYHESGFVAINYCGAGERKEKEEGL